jgi:hypothetical protein
MSTDLAGNVAKDVKVSRVKKIGRIERIKILFVLKLMRGAG